MPEQQAKQLKACPLCGKSVHIRGNCFDHIRLYCDGNFYGCPYTFEFRLDYDDAKRFDALLENLKNRHNSRPEEDALQAKVDALIELYSASREIMEARAEEHAAAVAEGDYMTGGKIHTAGRLEDARARVLSACDKGASAIAKCRALGVDI